MGVSTIHIVDTLIVNDTVLSFLQGQEGPPLRSRPHSHFFVPTIVRGLEVKVSQTDSRKGSYFCGIVIKNISRPLFLDSAQTHPGASLNFPPTDVNSPPPYTLQTHRQNCS